MKVVLLAAQSLDGWITHHHTAGDAFTSEADKKHFLAELRACDACVMGGTTYALSKDRLRPQSMPRLRRVVWTRHPEERLAETIPGVLEFSAEKPAQIMARLREDGRKRCALLGGGQVNAAWLGEGLVDEICLTVESRIFGSGTPLAGGASLDIKLELLEARTLATGGPMLVRYRVLP